MAHTQQGKNQTALTILNFEVAHSVLTLTMIPVIVLFNSVIILSVSVFRTLRGAHNQLTAAVACFDMLLGCVCSPLYANEDLVDSSKYGCLITYSFIITVFMGRSCFLLLLTLDRYVAILHPFWYHHYITFGEVKIWRYIVAGTTFCIVLVGALPLMGINTYKEGLCGFHTVWPDWYEYVFGHSVQALTLLVPTVLNIRIYRVVTELRKIENRLRMSASQEVKSRERRIAGNINVYFSYIVFYLPLCVTSFLRKYLHLSTKDTFGDLEQERAFIVYSDYIATTWYMGFMPSLTPILLICWKREYQYAGDLLAMTPFWSWWSELKYHKLGRDYGTSYTGTTAPPASPVASDLYSDPCPSCKLQPSIMNSLSMGQPKLANLSPRVSFSDSNLLTKYLTPASSRGSSVDQQRTIKSSLKTASVTFWQSCVNLVPWKMIPTTDMAGTAVDHLRRIKFTDTQIIDSPKQTRYPIERYFSPKKKSRQTENVTL